MTSRRSREGSTLTRRAVLLTCTGGAVSLAGCLSGDDDTADEPAGTLHVNAASTVDRPVRLQVAVREDGVPFEEAVVSTSSLRGGDSTTGTVDDVRGGPFQVVVRVDGEQWDDFEATWKLQECVELTLQPTVTETELGVTWQCSHPTGARLENGVEST